VAGLAPEAGLELRNALLSSSGSTGRSGTPRLLDLIVGVADDWMPRLRGA
jgi:hypothetical protein